jgi:RNA polymerase sigma-70 factor (ECF subfamily)
MKWKNDDILFIRLIGEGDERVFKYLFDTYFVSLCRFMHVFLENEQEIEEEAMDIFIYLWKNPEKIRPNLSIKAYLFQSARNKCLNVLRNKKRFVPIEEIENSITAEDPSILEMEELNFLIQQAILSLPEKSRNIFLRSRNDNQTYQEIADSMNISIKTVEKHITHSMKTIKKFLGDKYTYLF